MSEVEKASLLFEEGFSCSQAILAPYSDKLGLNRETALKISSGFGGGMHLGQVCGAVTGAFMVIGLKFGRIKISDLEAKQKTYALVKEFAEKFKERYGSIDCKELLGYDLSDDEQYKLAKEKNAFSVCPEFVKTAAEILEGIVGSG